MNTVNMTAPQLVVKPPKTELDLAREDKAAGRVTKWNSVDEMFDKVLGV